MYANWTETLDDFLETNESSTEWQAIVTLFNKMPSFNLNIADSDAESDNINFYDLFKLEYSYREIGQAYENQFYHEIKRALTKALIEYKPKITEYISNFTDLLNPLVALEETIDSEGNTTDSVYIQPINASSNKMSNKNESEGESTTTRSYQQQMTYNDTKTKIIDEFLNLKNIYLSALEYFDTCFMQLY